MKQLVAKFCESIKKWNNNNRLELALAKLVQDPNAPTVELSRSALWVSKWSGVLYSKNM